MDIINSPPILDRWGILSLSANLFTYIIVILFLVVARCKRIVIAY